MPEGDALHRAARRLQVLVGERVEVETPHPRAAAGPRRERLDGRRLESVEAAGKNLLLGFEGGLVLRSHLRMSGRWQVRARGAPVRGSPGSFFARQATRRCSGTGRCWSSHAATAPAGGSARTSSPSRPTSTAMVASLRGEHPVAASSATRCSTSAWSPGSGTSGGPRRSGTRGSRRGFGSRRPPTTSSTACSARRRDSMRGSLENGGAERARLPPRRPSVPALRRARSARAARATTTARPTGVPAAREERSRPSA